jgi:hypothetical protein
VSWVAWRCDSLCDCNLRFPLSFHLLPSSTLIKKKRKFSSDIRKFRLDRVQSYIWRTVSS